MREETQQVTCVFCNKPITPEQRPCVMLKNGDEVHIECWSEYQKAERRKVN